MPLYEVIHCITLSREQKDNLAQFITTLHATTFTTPTLFVNVTFNQPGPVGDVYIGAKPRGKVLPNHIRATIRTSPSRPKEMFDEVGTKIQARWDEIVNDTTLDAQLPSHLTTNEKANMKKLNGIVFCPLFAAIESGLVVPKAGEEGAWFKDHMPYFREQIDLYDNTDIKQMLQEVSEREDMAKLVA